MYRAASGEFFLQKGRNENGKHVVELIPDPCFKDVHRFRRKKGLQTVCRKCSQGYCKCAQNSANR